MDRMSPDEIRALAEYIAVRTMGRSSTFQSFITEFFQHQSAGIRDGRSKAIKLDVEHCQRLVREIKNHALASGRSAPSYLENYLTMILHDRTLTGVQNDMLERYLSHSREGKRRFVNWDDRQSDLTPLSAELIPGTELDPRSLLYSQGAGLLTFEWRGIPCLKTIYDIGIYLMLLGEFRPRSIIELGTGSGGSTAFLADVSRALDLNATIHSVDRERPSFDFNRADIRYYQSDCLEWMRRLAVDSTEVDRPCLIIEDYHEVNDEFFIQAERLLQSGDYLVVEDCLSKQVLIASALRSRDSFLVDTRFTDLFGINCTSAINGILRRS